MKQRLRLDLNHRLIRRNDAAPANAAETMETNMKVKWITVVLALAFAAGATWSHGNKVHVRGKIEKIGADSLQVKTIDGKSVEVKLGASTVYVLHTPTNRDAAPAGTPPHTSGDKPAKLADLAVGDAVVIHATPKGGTLEADEVKFSTPESTKVAAAGKPKS